MSRGGGRQFNATAAVTSCGQRATIHAGAVGHRHRGCQRVVAVPHPTTGLPVNAPCRWRSARTGDA